MGDSLLERVARLVAERRLAEAGGRLAEGVASADALAARALAQEVVRSAALQIPPGNVAHAKGYDALYRPLVEAFMAKFGPAAAEAAAMAERLALTYAYQHDFARAAETLEPVVAALTAERGESDREARRLRDCLAIHYRNAGRADLAEKLLPTARVCEHLRAVDAYLRDRGVKVAHVGQPWSRNCRTWVTYAGVILDTRALIERFGLSPPVEVHDHRGTHDGSEHGLYCAEHHDALVGAHPSSAGLPVVG